MRLSDSVATCGSSSSRPAPARRTRSAPPRRAGPPGGSGRRGRPGRHSRPTRPRRARSARASYGGTGGSRPWRRAPGCRAGAGVEVAAAREQLAVQRPVDDAAAGHPARADHQVGVAQGVEQRLELLGLVGAVGVHLADHVVPALEGHLEAVRYAAPRPSLLARCSTETCGSSAAIVSAIAGAVRGAVVDDQDVHLGLRGAQPLDERAQVERLVVGRDDHHDPTETGEVAQTCGEPIEGGAAADGRRESARTAGRGERRDLRTAHALVGYQSRRRCLLVT